MCVASLCFHFICCVALCFGLCTSHFVMLPLIVIPLNNVRSLNISSIYMFCKQCSLFVFESVLMSDNRHFLPFVLISFRLSLYLFVRLDIFSFVCMFVRHSDHAYVFPSVCMYSVPVLAL